MTPDIVERLRECHCDTCDNRKLEGYPCSCPHAPAADEITALRKRLEDAERDAAAVRELMNCYNLGGWTDSELLLKERNAAERERDEAYERAAKVCEERVLETPSDDDVRFGIRSPYKRDMMAHECAAAIRALAKGEK
jgi:hypothetical protein